MHRCMLLLCCLFLLVASPARAVTLDDPRYHDQWALAQIGAPCAWAITTGSTAVTVAVVDSGVDFTHPDLQGRLRSDGYDFVENDGDPTDENGHGTHIAGVIAATLGNAEGGAGLAPGVQILPVRVMDARGFGPDAAIAAGIRYAVARGARVINLSLGATLMISAETESAAVMAAIRAARAADVLVVVSAGNDFVPLPNAIAGRQPDALVVAALDNAGRKADFSNSGPWVAVSAPGVAILSTLPTRAVYLTSQLPPAERMRQGYDTMTGTSQATPFVTALAALLFSVHPEWSADEVARSIRSSAADVRAQNADSALGAGRIDACAALTGAASLPAVPRTTALRAVLDPRGVATLLLVALAGLAVPLLLVARRQRRTRPAARAAAPGSWGWVEIIDGPGARSRHALRGRTVLIGRSTACQISIIGDASVSRLHAQLVFADGQILISDAGSSHGIWHGSVRLRALTAVSRGTTLRLGQTHLRIS